MTPSLISQVASSAAGGARPRALLATALIAAVLLFAPRALCRPEPVEAVMLSYRAPTNCPDRRRFTREVRARTSRVRFVTSGAQRHFAVSIQASGGAFAGQLEIAGPSGLSRRHFSDHACNAVASALALVTALAIDPNASTAPASSLVLPASPSAAVPMRRRGRRPTTERHWQWDAGVDATALTGPASRALIALAPFVTGELRLGAPWTAAFRVQAFAAGSGLIGPEAPQARYRWFAARLELCPLRVRVARGVSAQPCVATDLGAVVARGTKVAHPLSATRAWWSAGLGARLRWDAGSGVFVEIAGHALAAITHDHFVFETPYEQVYAVHRMSFDGQIGAGVNFL